MSKDWKPGDVAMVNNCTQPDEPWKVALCIASAVPGVSETRWRIDTGEVWGSVSEARPLVVIDPEDRETAGRLSDLLIAAMCKSDPNWDDARAYEVRAHMRTALREYANPKPPLPDEPSDWSVVIVADRTPFVRTARAHIVPPYDHCWFGEHPRSGELVRLTWADLHDLGTVEVVGQGVQP